MSEDRCICCGAVIPEGVSVCPSCLLRVRKKKEPKDCKYCKDEFCVNAKCPMRADYCPVPDNPGVCRYEDRGGR